MRCVNAVAVVCTFGLLLSAAPARADGFVSPTVGVNFGGNAGTTLRGAVDNSQRLNVGAAVGWMSAGVFGLEEDFSWAPNFFGSGGVAIDKTRVLTLMTNVIAGVPVGGQSGVGIRPYVSVGVGLLNQHVSTPTGVGEFSQNAFGFDAGAGVMGYFADHIGLRGDVRYFRSFQDTESNIIGLEPGQFSFYRASLGVLFRF
ncbi:MAG TPA: outer membrane beta-barrel protein [Vicinamibacterales bacterium]|nr:outer membrane beta-barrel protein [Vicinamibacterales bacterium]